MQLRDVEWFAEELYESGLFPVTIAWMLGLCGERYVYDHEGD